MNRQAVEEQVATESLQESGREARESDRDVRSFMETLEQTGDMITVDREVHWDMELGAISRRMTEMDGPAIWFRNITDYPNQSLFVNPISTWRRAAVTLGLPAHARIPEIYEEYIRRDSNPIPPVEVKDSHCREVVIQGENVDVCDLATPMIHDGDGGRYIGTWCIVACQDPDTGWVNWGTYRFMIHNSEYLVGWPFPPSHCGKILQDKYVPQNRRMPVAIVMGADPASHLAATSTTRIGRDEASLAGGLAGHPIEVVRCLDSDLIIPASAECVLEGEILPDRIAHEGPYGEYPGYRSGEMGRGILMKVHTITHRKNPVLTMDCTGLKDCSSIVTALGGGVGIRRALERAGVPVTNVYVPAEGAVHLCIVSVHRGGRAVTERVLHALTGRRAYMTKIIVVDDDVDIFNLGEVIHAFATRSHSARGVIIKPYEGNAQTLTPCYDQEERSRRAGATAAFDATWPPSWDRTEIPVKATFEAIFPEEVKKKVLDNWKAYGF